MGKDILLSGKRYFIDGGTIESIKKVSPSPSEHYYQKLLSESLLQRKISVHSDVVVMESETERG